MSLTPLKKSPRAPHDRHYLAERLRVRAEMQSMGEDEISEVIDERALKARASKTEAPPSGVLERLGWFALQLVKAVNNGYALGALFLLAAVVALYFWLTLGR